MKPIMQKAQRPSSLTLGYISQGNALKVHDVTFARVFTAVLFDSWKLEAI